MALLDPLGGRQVLELGAPLQTETGRMEVRGLRVILASSIGSEAEIGADIT